MDNTQGRRVAVVTGGGRGIGRGIVTELAKLGYSLGVNFRDDKASAESACEEAVGLGSPRALPVRADVSDIEAGKDLVASILQEFGRIDLWVNNAGVAPRRREDLLDSTEESWDRVVETNLKGPFFLTQSVARAMLAQIADGTVTAPRIVFITSVSSEFASVNRPEYCAAKAGLSMVAQLYASRLAEQGILVYEVRPGLIETDMTRPVHDAYSQRITSGLTPIRRWGKPSDVGRAVAALASGAFPFTTGEIFHVDGGMHLRIL